MMGNQHGKLVVQREYDVSDVDSEEEEMEDVEECVEEGEVVAEEEAEPVAEPEAVEEGKKKRRRRRRRGKKAVEEATETAPIVQEPESTPIEKAEPEPMTPSNPEPTIPSEPEPVKPNRVKANATVKPPKDVSKVHTITIPAQELTKEKKETLRATNGPSPVKTEERTCFACKKVCVSRNQMNHHYGLCAEFRRAYPLMKADDRTWYMMIQYVRDNMKQASCMCMGCGVIFKSRHLLLEHNIKCRKAMDIDMWDRLTCFGLLFGTPYDDFVKFLPKYKERKVVPEYVSRVHRFVEDVKAAVLREKTEEILQDSRMEIMEKKAVKKYVDAVLEREEKEETEEREGPKGSTIGFGLGVGLGTSVGETPPAKNEPQECTCTRCKNAHVYPPVPHSDVWGAEKEGYFIIPLTLDGYMTVLNGRTIHIPTQNVLLRIHDVGPA
jgi:hypothetical protein